MNVGEANKKNPTDGRAKRSWHGWFLFDGHENKYGLMVHRPIVGK